MGPAHKQGPMPGTQGGFYPGKNMYPGAAPYPMGMSQPAHSHPHPHHMGHHHPHPHHMGPPGPPGPHSAPVRTPVDSPLDQGYFSNESAGNCSSGSAPSPAFTTSSMSSFSSISTMMPADQSSSSVQMQQQQQQKSSMMQPQQQHQGQGHLSFQSLTHSVQSIYFMLEVTAQGGLSLAKCPLYETIYQIFTMINVSLRHKDHYLSISSMQTNDQSSLFVFSFLYVLNDFPSSQLQPLFFIHFGAEIHVCYTFHS